MSNNRILDPIYRTSDTIYITECRTCKGDILMDYCILCRFKIDICKDCIQDIVMDHLKNPDFNFMNTYSIIDPKYNRTLSKFINIVFNKDYTNILCYDCVIKSIYSCNEIENEKVFYKILALLNIKDNFTKLKQTYKNNPTKIVKYDGLIDNNKKVKFLI
jgi:hypothetical protein